MIDLPDTPRWVEAHGIADDPTSWRKEPTDASGGHAGLAVGNDAAKLIVIVRAESSLFALAMANWNQGHTVLVATEELARAIGRSGRRVARAILHTLPEPDALMPVEGAVALPDDAPLDHLRPEVADEIRAARGKHTVWSVYVDGLPVAFAHAPWRSAKWFDISVDVDPSARQLGLGAIAATTLIHAEREQGREPVWGTDENNIASQRLAHRLGFEAVDELWVLAPL